jgi:hypothetical protein
VLVVGLNERHIVWRYRARTSVASGGYRGADNPKR